MIIILPTLLLMSNGEIYPIELKVPDLNKTYRLVYLANSNLSQVDLAIGKVAVKFNEPNPENRSL